MAKVRELKKVQKEPNKAIVALLEDLLNKAKQGKLIGFMRVGETDTGHAIRAHCLPDESNLALLQLLGLVEYEKDYLISLIKSNEES